MLVFVSIQIYHPEYRIVRKFLAAKEPKKPSAHLDRFSKTHPNPLVRLPLRIHRMCLSIHFVLKYLGFVGFLTRVNGQHEHTLLRHRFLAHSSEARS